MSIVRGENMAAQAFSLVLDPSLQGTWEAVGTRAFESIQMRLPHALVCSESIYCDLITVDRPEHSGLQALPGILTFGQCM